MLLLTVADRVVSSSLVVFLLYVTPLHMITLEARYVSLLPAGLLGQYISHLAGPTANYKINTQKLILVTVT